MKKNFYRILIVDDEEDICEILQFNLEGEGFAADVMHSAEAVLEKDLTPYHLILLDVMMGNMSGFKLAEILRKEIGFNKPIIFLTAKTTENDLLTGYNLGGDDYIKKPFSIKEVVARIRAVINRSYPQEPEQTIMGQLKIDHQEKRVFIGPDEIILTRKEFEILQLLVSNPGRIFSREEILKIIWRDDVIVTVRTVDVHVARLRKKIEVYKKSFKSKPGFGYTFLHDSLRS